MSEKVPSGPGMSDSVDAFSCLHVMAWRSPLPAQRTAQEFQFSCMPWAECFIPCGEFGFNWFLSAPGKTGEGGFDRGTLIHFLSVGLGNSIKPNTVRLA